MIKEMFRAEMQLLEKEYEFTLFSKFIFSLSQSIDLHNELKFNYLQQNILAPEADPHVIISCSNEDILLTYRQLLYSLGIDDLGKNKKYIELNYYCFLNIIAQALSFEALFTFENKCKWHPKLDWIKPMNNSGISLINILKTEAFQAISRLEEIGIPAKALHCTDTKNAYVLLIFDHTGFADFSKLIKTVIEKRALISKNKEIPIADKIISGPALLASLNSLKIICFDYELKQIQCMLNALREQKNIPKEIVDLTLQYASSFFKSPSSIAEEGDNKKSRMICTTHR